MGTLQEIPLRPPNLGYQQPFSLSGSEVSSFVTSTSKSTISDASSWAESVVSDPQIFNPRIVSPDQLKTAWNDSQPPKPEVYLTQQAPKDSGLAKQNSIINSSRFLDVNSTSYTQRERHEMRTTGINPPSQQVTARQYQSQQQTRQFQPRVIGFSQETHPGNGVTQSQINQAPLMNSNGQPKNPSKAASAPPSKVPGLSSDIQPVGRQRFQPSDCGASHAPGSFSLQRVPSQYSNQIPERAMNMAPHSLSGQVAMQQQPRVDSSPRATRGTARSSQGQQHRLYTYEDNPAPFLPSSSTRRQRNSNQTPLTPQNFGNTSMVTHYSFQSPAMRSADRQSSATAPLLQSSYFAVPDIPTSQYLAATPARCMISEDAERLRARQNSTRTPQQQPEFQYQQHGSQPEQNVPSFSHPSLVSQPQSQYPVSWLNRPNSQQAVSGGRLRAACEACRGSENQAYRYHCNHVSTRSSTSTRGS